MAMFCLFFGVGNLGATREATRQAARFGDWRSRPWLQLRRNFLGWDALVDRLRETNGDAIENGDLTTRKIVI